jgi:hypothetical protein
MMTMRSVNYAPGMVNASLVYRYAAPESGFAQMVRYPWARQAFDRPRASWGSIRNFNTGWGSIWEAGQGFRAIGTGQTVQAPIRTTSVSTAPFGAVVESGLYDPADFTLGEMIADPEWCCEWHNFDCGPEDCAPLSGAILPDDRAQGHVDPRDYYTPGMDDETFTTQPEDDPAVKRMRARRADFNGQGGKSQDVKPSNGGPGNNVINPTKTPKNGAGPAQFAAGKPTGIPWLLIGIAAAGGYALWRANK